jgi:hypothetical protein
MAHFLLALPALQLPNRLDQFASFLLQLIGARLVRHILQPLLELTQQLGNQLKLLLSAKFGKIGFVHFGAVTIDGRFQGVECSCTFYLGLLTVLELKEP